MGSNKGLKRIRIKITRNKTTTQILLLAAALAVIIIAMCIATDRFYQWKNISNVLVQITSLGIAAIGAGIIMISGGIDLTLGNVISFSASCTAAMIIAEYPLGLAITLGVLIAVLCGTLNGVLIVLSKAEPFIITLGMMSVYKGVTLFVTRGTNLSAASAGFTFAREKIIFDTIPIPLLCLAFVYIVMYLVLKYSKFGRRIYAIGSNTEAAYLTGIKIKRNKLYIYTLNGLLLGISAMILLSRLSSANSTMGESMLMEAIAAAVIGGVAMAGGRGSVWGILLGTLLIGVISNSLNLLRVDSFYQYIVLGAIIVGAVFISNIGRKNR